MSDIFFNMHLKHNYKSDCFSLFKTSILIQLYIADKSFKVTKFHNLSVYAVCDILSVPHNGRYQNNSVISHAY